MGSYLDSRDLMEELVELEEERQAFTEAYESACEANAENLAYNDEAVRTTTMALTGWSEEKEEQYIALKKLCAEGEKISGDWKYGATLIPEDKWVEHVQDMLYGDIESVPWYVKIDWEATAETVAHDYHQVVFQGETYYVR